MGSGRTTTAAPPGPGSPARPAPGAHFGKRPFTFITEGLTSALDRAKAVAGSKNVLVHSPDVAQQLLRAGLLDEIQLHLVPFLLTEGRRLFEHIGQASRDLKLTGVIEAPDVTHLRYRLRK